jgi:hypothetical protein
MVSTCEMRSLPLCLHGVWCRYKDTTLQSLIMVPLDQETTDVYRLRIEVESLQ